MIPSVHLLGLNFADLNAAEAAASIAVRPANAPFAYVVTPNADHLVRLSRDATLSPIYENAILRLLDSRVVAGSARMMGLLPPRVASGSDVTAALLFRHLQPGEPVTVVGLHKALVPSLMARCGIAAIAHHNPPMGFEHAPEAFQQAITFVLENPARFIFLAVGSPRQERLAAAIAATGRATGTGLCIGASLEFLAGAKRRATAWMRRAGLEWMVRMASDPGRLGRRYLLENPAVFRLLWRARAGRSYFFAANSRRSRSISARKAATSSDTFSSGF
jgi:N-acetylglucosaminyldiphosphoundecaprenol N-acetyl-beta-D-mannosaminyltransferase